MIDVMGQHDMVRLFLYFGVLIFLLLILELIFTSNYMLWPMLYYVFNFARTLRKMLRKNPQNEQPDFYDDCLSYTFVSILLYFAAMR